MQESHPRCLRRTGECSRYRIRFGARGMCILPGERYSRRSSRTFPPAAPPRTRAARHVAAATRASPEARVRTDHAAEPVQLRLERPAAAPRDRAGAGSARCYDDAFGADLERRYSDAATPCIVTFAADWSRLP